MWTRIETQGLEDLLFNLSSKMFVFRNINIGIKLLAIAMLDLHVKSCSEDEFLLEGSFCCHFCTEGRYKATNCTKNENGYVESGSCVPCTKCADGVEMITSCTNFTDAVCGKKFTDIASTMTTVTPTPSGEQVITHMALYATATVVFVMIIAAVLYKWCTRRSASHDPAREPFKIMI